MLKTILILGVGCIALIWGGSLVAFLVCRKLRPPEGIDPAASGAGKYTGYFERLLVGASVFLGLPGLYVAVAFLLVGKLIMIFRGRHDHPDSNRVERLLAGTVASLCVALFVGYFMKLLLPDLFPIHEHAGLGSAPGGMGYPSPGGMYPGGGY